MVMNSCLCCDNTLLRHVRQGGLYWYCSHCRQEMPNVTAQSVSASLRKLEKDLLLPSPTLKELTVH